MVRSPVRDRLSPRFVPIGIAPFSGCPSDAVRNGKGVATSIQTPSKHGENLSVDDHSPIDSRSRSTGDCSAAECIEPEPSISDSTIVEPTTAEATLRVRLRPFVWQSGRRVLLLEREHGYWVLAELQFEPAICRYTELRRAFYRWEREAVGALLSRTIGYGATAASESAEQLDAWMSSRR